MHFVNVSIFVIVAVAMIGRTTCLPMSGESVHPTMRRVVRKSCRGLLNQNDHIISLNKRGLPIPGSLGLKGMPGLSSVTNTMGGASGTKSSSSESSYDKDSSSASGLPDISSVTKIMGGSSGSKSSDSESSGSQSSGTKSGSSKSYANKRDLPPNSRPDSADQSGTTLGLSEASKLAAGASGDLYSTTGLLNSGIAAATKVASGISAGAKAGSSTSGRTQSDTTQTDNTRYVS